MKVINLVERYEERLDVLKQWSNDENIYISFTNIDKIGIKPSYRWNTPLAVYAYPLKELWDEIMEFGIEEIMTFGSSRKYIKVLKGFNVTKISEYSQKNLDMDIKKLSNLYPKENVIDIYNKVKNYLYNLDSNFVNFPFKILYHVITDLSDKFPSKPCITKNKLLRQLGYDAISDDKGSGSIGSISSSIPCQTLFLTPKSYKLITTILNINKPIITSKEEKEEYITNNEENLDISPENIKLAAVKMDGTYIQNISNPSETIQLAAIRYFIKNNLSDELSITKLSNGKEVIYYESMPIIMNVFPSVKKLIIDIKSKK